MIQKQLKKLMRRTGGYNGTNMRIATILRGTIGFTTDVNIRRRYRPSYKRVKAGVETSELRRALFSGIEHQRFTNDPSN